MRNEPSDLSATVGQKDRDPLVTPLQALWRERVAARAPVASVAQVRAPVADEAFGIEEVATMLRRVGAAATR
ncbi:hypothetical protein RKE25_22430 (plasmid) [Dyella sp. BiH032]|uniref:hypothetical protein n=1 Tax=Dyella sp. BiH032 TaxID=3075430 RepID=UPI002892A550|nr:hypothetical protein [Dyella sp. BiH032]WNL48490.1 hypothetical protein RKE25_22430 [Dyella sp. BiH032]